MQYSLLSSRASFGNSPSSLRDSHYSCSSWTDTREGCLNDKSSSTESSSSSWMELRMGQDKFRTGLVPLSIKKLMKNSSWIPIGCGHWSSPTMVLVPDLELAVCLPVSGAVTMYVVHSTRTHTSWDVHNLQLWTTARRGEPFTSKARRAFKKCQWRRLMT